MKIHNICIETNTYEESKKFYIEILGFKLVKLIAPERTIVEIRDEIRL